MQVSSCFRQVSSQTETSSICVLINKENWDIWTRVAIFRPRMERPELEHRIALEWSRGHRLPDRQTLSGNSCWNLRMFLRTTNQGTTAHSSSNLNRKIKSADKLSGGSPKATATSGFRKHKQNFKSESADCWNRNRTISCGEVVQRNEYDLLPSSPMSIAAGHEYDMQLSRKAGVMADVRVKMEPDRMASPTLSRSSSGYALVEPPPDDQFYGMELRRATDGRIYDRLIQLPVVAIQLPVLATQFPHRRPPITCDDGSQPDCREDTSSDFGSGSCVTVDIASPSQPLDYRNESSVSPTLSASGECRNWRQVQPTPVQVQNFQTQLKFLDAKPKEDDDIVCTENNPPSRTAATVAGGGTEDPHRSDQNPIQNAIKHSSTADYDDYNLFRKFKRFRKCEPTTVTETDNVIETGHVTGARQASDTELVRDTGPLISVTNTAASPSCASSTTCLVSNSFASSDIDQTSVRERSPEISNDCIVFKKNDATSGLNDAISGLNDTTSGSNDANFGPNNAASGPNDASVQCSLLPKVSTRDIAVQCLLLESNPELTTEFSSMDLSSSYNVTLDEIDATGSHLKREPEQDSLYSGTPDGLSLTTDCCNRCNFCGITFDDDVIYSIHMGCHSHRDPFICNLCGRRCNGKYAFNTHIVRGHQSA